MPTLYERLGRPELTSESRPPEPEPEPELCDEPEPDEPARPRKRPPPPGCSAPTFRKGAMKQALVLDRAARAELVTRPDPGEPVEAVDLRDLALKLGAKAMRVLEGDLGDLDPRARQEAARALAAVCTKFAELPEPVKVEPNQEEREAQLEAALASPRLRAFLESRGWRRDPGP